MRLVRPLFSVVIPDAPVSDYNLAILLLFFNPIYVPVFVLHTSLVYAVTLKKRLVYTVIQFMRPIN
jgi:hypothetical protein